MASHLTIFVRNGHIQSVLADFPNDIECLVVRAEENANGLIQGEPWVKPMDFPFPETDSMQVSIEPMPVEFDPAKVRSVVDLGNDSRKDLRKMLC